MSVKQFTSDEIEILKRNPYIKEVTKNTITYTAEFKRIVVVECEKGKTAKNTFLENGFDPEMLGKDRYCSARKRWLKAFKKNGVLGLSDSRNENRKCSFEKLSIKEKYERVIAENKLLKAENELLKKLELEERRLKKDR